MFRSQRNAATAAFLSVLSITASACGGDETFPASELIGTFGGEIDPGIRMWSHYKTGASIDIPYTYLGYTGVEPTVDGLMVTYNATNATVSFGLMTGMVVEQRIHVPADKVLAEDEDGNVRPFHPSLQKLVEIRAELDFYSPFQNELSNGCVMVSRQVIKISVRRNDLRLAVDHSNEYRDTSWGGPSAGDYKSCRTVLKEQELLVRTSDPAADFAITSFVDKSAVNLDRLPDLTRLGLTMSVTSDLVPAGVSASPAFGGTAQPELEVVGVNDDGAVFEAVNGSVRLQ